MDVPASNVGMDARTAGAAVHVFSERPDKKGGGIVQMSSLIGQDQSLALRDCGGIQNCFDAGEIRAALENGHPRWTGTDGQKRIVWQEPESPRPK